MYSQKSAWQKASIGSGNGLAPNRRQTIIWTNADPVHCRIYAALRGDELIPINRLKKAFIESCGIGR